MLGNHIDGDASQYRKDNVAKRNDEPTAKKEFNYLYQYFAPFIITPIDVPLEKVLPHDLVDGF